MPRCADCGFLATQHHETRELVETEQRTRDTGRVPTVGDKYDEIPVCFARAILMLKEVPNRQADQILAAIQKERVCESFTPWIQGFTPKEHKEMLNDKEMRAWQVEQREKERAWQDEQRKAEREWQESQKAAEREWQKSWQVRMAIFSAGLSAILGAAGFTLGRLLR